MLVSHFIVHFCSFVSLSVFVYFMYRVLCAAIWRNKGWWWWWWWWYYPYAEAAHKIIIKAHKNQRTHYKFKNYTRAVILSRYVNARTFPTADLLHKI